MTTAITATFPYRVYRGHGPSGTAEPLPEQPRLFSALVHAAYTGSTATPDPQDPHRLLPSEDALRALAWFEKNPPDCLEIPEAHPLTTRERAVYRDEGYLEKDNASKSVRAKKRAKPMSDGFAVTGHIAWGWKDTPVPEDVAQTLEQLCADVGYLGETDSPAILSVVDDLEPTHLRVADPTPQDLRWGTVLSTVAPGRRQVLDEWHDALHPAGRKAFKPEKWTLTAPTAPPAAPRDGLRRALYAPVDREIIDAPWEMILLLRVEGMGREPTPDQRVRLATATHQTLVRMAGDGELSPLLTGKGGLSRGLANGLAIHLLTAQESKFIQGAPTGNHLVIMIPHGAQGEDIEQILTAARRLRRVYTREAGVLTVDETSERLLDGASFWSSPAPGTPRVWRTQTPAVAERRTKALGPLSPFDVTALWSLGNVFRDLRGEELVNGRDPLQRVLDTAAALSDDDDTASISTHSYTTTKPYRLVHRTNGNMPVRPYTMTLHAPGLLSPTGLIALGQSRHLSGGLLVPHEAVTTTEGEAS